MANKKGVCLYSGILKELQSGDSHAWSDVDKAGSSVKDLADVDAAMSPSDGDVLTYDSASGKWTSAAPGSASADETARARAFFFAIAF